LNLSGGGGVLKRLNIGGGLYMFISFILPFLLLLFIVSTFYKGPTPFTHYYNIITIHHDTFVAAVEDATKYDTGDILKINNGKEDNNNLTYLSGAQILFGDIYVVHNTIPVTMELIARRNSIEENAIREVFFDNSIKQIVRNENTIQFCGDDSVQLEKSADERFFGFYYSLTEKPQLIHLTDGELMEHGEGWSYFNNHFNYFTQIISGNFYYYQIDFLI